MFDQISLPLTRELKLSVREIELILSALEDLESNRCDNPKVSAPLREYLLRMLKDGG